MPHCYLTDLSSALSAHWRSIRACAQMCDTILRNKKVDMVIYGYVGLQQFRFWFLTDKLDWSIVLSLTLLLKLADAEVFKLRGAWESCWWLRREGCEAKTLWEADRWLSVFWKQQEVGGCGLAYWFGPLTYTVSISSSDTAHGGN